MPYHHFGSPWKCYENVERGRTRNFGCMKRATEHCGCEAEVVVELLHMPYAVAGRAAAEAATMTSLLPC